MNKAQSSSADIANALAEERERKIAEERANAALKLQRKQRLQAMIIKRQRNLAYLKKVHQGGCYWLNTILLTHADLLAYSTKFVSKQRVESFFSLGISISKIVELNAGLPVVRAFSQLMEEWEYVHSGTTMQSVKFMMAKNSTCVYPQMSPIEGFSDLARPSVYKFNNAVVFEHLRLPHIPFELDYLEVFTGLCVELSKLYEKLIHEECYANQIIYDTIVRLDTRVKHHIINLVSKEVTDACSAKMKSNTRSLRSLAGIFFPSSNNSNHNNNNNNNSANNHLNLSKAGSAANLTSAGTTTASSSATTNTRSASPTATLPFPPSPSSSAQAARSVPGAGSNSNNSNSLPTPPPPSAVAGASAAPVRTENPIQQQQDALKRKSSSNGGGKGIAEEAEETVSSTPSALPSTTESS
eukprot:CAMPEP_0184990686 /NCGR_PEP_ID=MMETSP1098-20130426/33552_1 /TAXON_ID=89044 /ORGANISM="Spumella elongata, Strain CCAP 955/1" /LENGTH=411 /DNA_ID=CAMNT_0027515937 /DNA_START=30 /DNA_END=1268 /DNA_ORIENTATION=-